MQVARPSSVATILLFPPILLAIFSWDREDSSHALLDAGSRPSETLWGEAT